MEQAEQEIFIEEYKALRAEIAIRLKLLHDIIAFATIFWVVLLIAGIWILTFESYILLNTYLLIIPLVFTGIIFNYQDNQRTLEITAKYVEKNLKSVLSSGLEWEQYFAKQKKSYQISSAYKIFALIVPLVIPVVLLISQKLTNFQIVLAIIDLFFLCVVLINFRYKLYRIK